MSNSKVKLGLARRNDEDLLVFSRTVVTNMTGNANFPTPTPALADVTAAADAFETAIEAAAGGGVVLTEQKNVARATLLELMRQLGYYVQSASEGDKEKILTSGMDVARTPTPIGQLPAPGNLLTRFSDFSGVVDLDWDSVYGSTLYTVEINETDPNEEKAWTPVHSTTKSKASISALEPGTFYWFRVRANGAAGVGPASDPARGLAA